MKFVVLSLGAALRGNAGRVLGTKWPGFEAPSPDYWGDPDSRLIGFWVRLSRLKVLMVRWR